MKARRPFTEKSTHIFFERTHPYPKGGGCGVGLGRDTLNEATGTVNPSDYIYYMRAKTGWLMVIRIAFFLSMSSVFVRFSFFFCFPASLSATALQLQMLFFIFLLFLLCRPVFFSRPLFSQCNFLFPFFFCFSGVLCVPPAHLLFVGVTAERDWMLDPLQRYKQNNGAVTYGKTATKKTGIVHLPLCALDHQSSKVAVLV